MITEDLLKQMPAGTIFAEGVARNAPGELYMTNTKEGNNLKWIAVRGKGYHDWVIYCNWETDPWTNEMIAMHGSKIPRRLAEKLIKADKSGWKLYRQ